MRTQTRVSTSPDAIRVCVCCHLAALPRESYYSALARCHRASAQTQRGRASLHGYSSVMFSFSFPVVISSWLNRPVESRAFTENSLHEGNRCGAALLTGLLTCSSLEAYEGGCMDSNDVQTLLVTGEKPPPQNPEVAAYLAERMCRHISRTIQESG